jgi:alcohol dehydrogenase class IV
MGHKANGVSEAGNADVIASCIRSLRKQLGINSRLSDMGVVPEAFPKLAQFAFNDPCLATNPREAEPRDIEQILQQIYT